MFNLGSPDGGRPGAKWGRPRLEDIMREEFHSQLSRVSDWLAAMADAVRTAMHDATDGLLAADAAKCERVTAADAEIDAMYRVIEDTVVDLLARQSPVASDLRLLVASLYIAGDLERMGDLAKHVAETALRRRPACAVPAPLTEVFTEMGQISDQIAMKIGRALSTSDAVVAAELERDDDLMDGLHRRLFEVLLDGTWNEGIEAAIDTTLLGRFYERYADHAVNAGRRLVFLVTGDSMHARR
jgi:phosphate transport system protein